MAREDTFETWGKSNIELFFVDLQVFSGLADEFWRVIITLHAIKKTGTSSTQCPFITISWEHAWKFSTNEGKPFPIDQDHAGVIWENTHIKG